MSVSHDYSEIIQICSFAAQETYIISITIIINVQDSCVASYLSGNCDTFSFGII